MQDIVINHPPIRRHHRCPQMKDLLVRGTRPDISLLLRLMPGVRQVALGMLLIRCLITKDTKKKTNEGNILKSIP